MHDLVFLANNFEWAASTIAELYKARWQVELLFKELKQTLQLQDFFGENENAVQECARTEGAGLGGFFFNAEAHRRGEIQCALRFL